MHAKDVLLEALAIVAALYAFVFAGGLGRARDGDRLTPAKVATGCVTNFFDTRGTGSYAPTTALFRFWKMVPDERIPGTLNVGHTLPTIAQAFIFTRIVPVDARTLILMIGASMVGAWLGAGVVASWSRRTVQVGMGLALIAAAGLMLARQLELTPAGGDALGLTGLRLVVAVGVHFALGALMALGIGLYAPCMILVSLLAMTPTTPFPVIMGPCAFLSPVATAPSTPTCSS